jgi:hypothetical protein
MRRRWDDDVEPGGLTRPTAWWDDAPPSPSWRQTVTEWAAAAADGLLAAAQAGLWIAVLLLGGAVWWGALRYWGDVLEGLWTP